MKKILKNEGSNVAIDATTRKPLFLASFTFSIIIVLRRRRRWIVICDKF